MTDVIDLNDFIEEVTEQNIAYYFKQKMRALDHRTETLAFFIEQFGFYLEEACAGIPTSATESPDDISGISIDDDELEDADGDILDDEEDDTI